MEFRCVGGKPVKDKTYGKNQTASIGSVVTTCLDLPHAGEAAAGTMFPCSHESTMRAPASLGQGVVAIDLPRDLAPEYCRPEITMAYHCMCCNKLTKRWRQGQGALTCDAGFVR